MTLRAVIVDDEELARGRIRQTLEAEEDVQVVAECEGGKEAIAAIRREKPDLVFLDVQMPEVDGFEVLRQLPDDEMPVVVFVTAHEEHALRAFEVHALDYLLKPFRDERLRDALERARQLRRGATDGELARSMRALLDTVGAHERGHERLAVRTPGRVLFLSTEEIDWFEAAGNYILVHVGERSHLLRETMTELERRLDPARFARAHRSTIVNLDRVREVRVSASGDGRIVLRDRRELPLSRRYRRSFEQALGV